MHIQGLPGYLSIKVIEDDIPPDEDYDYNNRIGLDWATVKVEIHSTIHCNKVRVMPNAWSVGFVRWKPNQFRGDVLSYILRVYSLTQDPVTYS